MSKTATKFTAQFTTKIGKTPVEIKIPLDFTQAKPGQSYDDYVASVTEDAQGQLSTMFESANVKLKNQADLKRAHKAFSKSQSA